MFVVSAADLRRLVPMEDAIDAVQSAFVAVADGSAEQPQRLVTADGSALAMMARRSNGPGGSGTAFKLVSVWEPNRRRNLPTVHAIALWFDAETKRPRLLIEGGSLTALRTGAASGVATRLLARENASVLAIIGAGGQAPDQIRAVCAVRPIDEVRIFSRRREPATTLASRLAAELAGVQLHAVSTTEEATAGADIVCCATNSPIPVISSKHINGRVHINAIGSYQPAMTELATELVTSAELVTVDSVEAATTEAGEIIAAIASKQLAQAALVEIGTLIGTAPPSLTGLSIFKSVGLAIQDWAICQLIHERIPADAAFIDL